MRFNINTRGQYNKRVMIIGGILTCTIQTFQILPDSHKDLYFTFDF